MENADVKIISASIQALADEMKKVNNKLDKIWDDHQQTREEVLKLKINFDSIAEGHKGRGERVGILETEVVRIKDRLQTIKETDSNKAGWVKWIVPLIISFLGLGGGSLIAFLGRG